MATDKKSEKQVMDVSKPGKTPAAASARPVIVGHKNQIQDPMVNSAEEPNPDVPAVEESVAPAVASPAASKKVIAPITESVAPEQKPEETEPAPEVTAEAGENAAPATDEPETSESAEVDVLADQVGNKKKEEQQLSEEERKKQEAIEKLVADKQYFVPIGKAYYKSQKSVAVIIILLVIIIAGGIAAVDAGLLDVGIDLPFDFIKNN